MTSHVFLSYSKQDVNQVRELYDRLVHHSVPVWMDERNLLPGQDWESEIKKAIRKSAAILMCLSSKWAHTRGYVQKELKLALDTLEQIPEGKIFLIPVKLDDCVVPDSLSHLQWVELFDPDGLGKLQAALASLITADPSAGDFRQKTQISAFQELLEEMISRGSIFHEDLWLPIQPIPSRCVGNSFINISGIVVARNSFFRSCP